MNRKHLLTVGLLGFVALSLTVAVADVAGWRRNMSSQSLAPSRSETPNSEALTSDSATTSPALTAIYFHAPHRCPTCKKIEKYTHEALQPDIAGGQLAWEVLDYTSPENAEIVDQFQVLTSTVVLTETQAGQIVRWKNVEEVWDHTQDQAEFVAFMRDTWHGFREDR
ncbi:MAG: nitrophenyl compound nitroreductase subunit ArsF family protein [Pirellulaceae bacterium]